MLSQLRFEKYNNSHVGLSVNLLDYGSLFYVDSWSIIITLVFLYKIKNNFHKS
jgi:hypothetical protein